jgi:hypothetical protein
VTEESTLVLGGYSSDNYTGSIEWFPNEKNDTWSIEGTSFVYTYDGFGDSYEIGGDYILNAASYLIGVPA